MNAIEKSDLTRIPELIIKGIECWIEAGEIVAEVLNKNPNAMDEICNETGLSADIVRRFEQIGRKEIFPKLLAGAGPGYRKLAKCPYREQEQYTQNPVGLLIMSDGGPDVLAVKLEALTCEQCKQVFASDHVRDTSEQRAWIESQREKEVQKAMLDRSHIQSAAFYVKNKRVIFRAGCELNASELATLLAKVTS